MKKRWTALLLACWMLVCTGCGGKTAEEEPPAEETALSQTEPAPVPPDPEPVPVPEPEPDPEPEPLVWTTEPVLSEQELPGSYQGLELPVKGATGYTSVDLALWTSPDDATAARRAVADWERRQAEWEAAKNAAAAAQMDGTGAESGVQRRERSGTAPEIPEPQSAETLPPESPENPEVPAETAEPEAAPVSAEELPADIPEEIPEEPPAEAEAPEPVPVPEPEPLEPKPSINRGSLAILPAGTPLTILEENGDWWRVRCTVKQKELTGWVAHRYCFINLPDVIPSIIFNATNGYSSRFVSCGKPLEGITGQQLYTGKIRNPRLEEEEFMMPVLYSMAPRLCEAQQAALREGNSLVLYEGYRPAKTQKQVAGSLRELMGVDKEVQQAVTAKPWGITWFIATGTSNHQRGYAVDVSLARVRKAETRQSGAYTYTRIREYEEYEMPTPVHELSPAAATFTTPVSSNSATAWKTAPLSETMASSESALGLQGYCTGAGLTPLASEWWHYNHLESRERVLDNPGNGGFEITVCLSETP